MKITSDLTSGILTANETVFKISCNVRTLKNGKRKRNEVVRSIPDGEPYDPRPFPKGLWNVTEVEWQKDRGFDPGLYGPVKIRTNAKQKVNVWSLDKDGDYLTETERRINDEGYLLHYSTSGTTLGCIRMNSADDAIVLARLLQKVLDGGGTVQLEVL